MISQAFTWKFIDEAVDHAQLNKSYEINEYRTDYLVLLYVE